MPFPKKFKGLLEIGPGDVEPPRHACLVYAVCGGETRSCGWQGWVLAGAWRAARACEEVDNKYDLLLPGGFKTPCPRCGRQLFSTDAEAWFRAAERPFPPVACECTPMTYVDDPDRLLAEEYLPLGLKRVRWADRRPGADDDHEHCDLCHARISDDPYDQHEAMSDGLYRWVCLRCWKRIEPAAPGYGQ